MTADGWVPTAIGIQYFKYNRDEYETNTPRGWPDLLVTKNEDDKNGSLTKKRSRTRLARSP